MNQKLIRTVIVEDEEQALDLFSSLVEATGIAAVVASTSEPREAVDLIVATEPDILFLDIRMPGMNGFDILNELHSKQEVNPHVVFTTAYDEYAVKAFNYAAFDYLLKSIDPERLRETFNRYLKDGKGDMRDSAKRLTTNGKMLLFKSINGAAFIDPNDIAFVTADGNYSTFHLTTGRTETVTSQLGAIEGMVDNRFFRTGRSSIINTSLLARIDNRLMQCVLVKDGKEFRSDISRDSIKLLMDYMKTRVLDI